MTRDAGRARGSRIKPMNCPGHVQIFKHGLKSYRDLPLRIAEFGKVHRYEPSGALHGLMRVRGFTQDDAHIFCTERADRRGVPEGQRPDPVDLRAISASPDVRIKFSDAARRSASAPTRCGTRREAALQDGAGSRPGRPSRPRSTRAKARSTGRSSNMCCATPSAATGSAAPCRSTSICRNGFGAFYIDADGSKKAPVMMHRAICGSIERFIGILIEHFAGNFPLWLAPVQAVVATITSDADEYAKVVAAAARRAGLRVEIDLRNEKINYKVREHSLAKVPVLLVVGKREAEEQDRPRSAGSAARRRRRCRSPRRSG